MLLFSSTVVMHSQLACCMVVTFIIYEPQKEFTVRYCVHESNNTFMHKQMQILRQTASLTTSVTDCDSVGTSEAVHMTKPTSPSCPPMTPSSSLSAAISTSAFRSALRSSPRPEFDTEPRRGPVRPGNTRSQVEFGTGKPSVKTENGWNT